MRFLLIILFFYSCHSALSQDTLTYSNLSPEQHSDWKKEYDNWLKNKFYPFLKKEKIKTSCAGCSSVYAIVVFKRIGEITMNTIVESGRCGKPFKGKQLEQLQIIINELFLPDSFKRSFFSVKIGSFLKC
jgi:hypothetical protein